MRVGLAKTVSENVVSSFGRVFNGRPVVAWLEADWASLLWPACQQGLTQLLCRYTRNAPGCETLTSITREARALRAPGQLLFALGLVADAHQIGKAISKSLKSGTARPAAAQATRSLANWSAVWAGAELFGTGGAWLGLATGPGAAVTTGVGALVGGCVGFFASEWIARRIEAPN
jgi:hypothetical protein